MCRRRKTWDVDVPRPWRVDSRPTGTAEQDHAMTCKQAPSIWNQFSVLQATSGAVSAPEWYDHVGEHQWRAVPPRSVLTVAVELDHQSSGRMGILADLTAERLKFILGLCYLNLLKVKKFWTMKRVKIIS